MRKSNIVAAAALAASLVATSVAAFAYPGQNMAKDAKITIQQAESIALKAVPGKIVAEELESEQGGTGLRYSFDIKTAAATKEVGVDAQTGAVLEDSTEGAGAD
ncbi:MAG: PepSY domain-containing protein [Vulcanimicrobiaceae bacterium]